MKQLIITLPIFYLIVFFNTTAATAYNIPEKARPMQRIEIEGIDTSGNLETHMAYPDEFLGIVIEEKMDSLMNSWFIRQAYDINSNIQFDSLPENFLGIDDAETLQSTCNTLSDSTYIQRLSAIETPIDLSFNSTVKNVITLYTEKRREQVEIMLGMANFYFPIFEEILDKYNMPQELKYMAIIESALNAKALSRAGASGLWQFMYGTGKMYGLEITSFVDERRDPIKASDAAAHYLNDLYKIYNDWHLVIAAYNCGPGNVNKAIRRSGGTGDYWSIYYHLPKETRGYVPAFIAAAYTFNYYKLYNLSPRASNLNIITDTIMVNNYLHFEQICATTGIEMELLRDLNPIYRLDVIPATEKKYYPLRLPQNLINTFIDNEQAVFAYKREKYFPNNQIKNPSQTTHHHVPNDIKGKAKVYYTVKSGDNVGYISDWFKLRTSDLRYWNNINGNLIRVGQKLLVYVPESKADYYKKFTSMSFEDKQQAIGKSTNTASNSTVEKPTIDQNYEYYTVRSGDNLWTIAQKYPGISASEIQKLNNISNSKSLNIGQKLKIKKK